MRDSRLRGKETPGWARQARGRLLLRLKCYQKQRFSVNPWLQAGTTRTGDNGFSGQPLSSTFANFRNSLCYQKLQIIPHWFMHFPKSKIHKELGHCPDAGYPKMAKVELERHDR